MNKREFIKKIGVYGLASTSASWLIQSCASINENTKNGSIEKLKNWIWVRPQGNWSVEDWKKELSNVKESGFDAILFESYNGHSSMYKHFDKRIKMHSDLLMNIIKICKEVGLEFHAWMWSMICNIEEIVQTKTDWYAVNRLGQRTNTHPAYVDYYKFMDPLHPEVQEFVKNNVKSLAEIDGVHGVHLDYIRMPDVILAEGLQPKYNIIQDKEYAQYDYNYSPLAREIFKGKTGIDPLTDLQDHAANEQWKQFRYDSITNLVNRHLVPEAKKYKKQITAAVFPNWQSVRQQWQNWDLDGFLPMLYHGFYNREIDFLTEHIQKNISLLNNMKPIYSGLYVDHIKDNIQEAFDTSISAGAKGIALFSLDALKKNHWEELQKIGLKK